MASNIFYGPTHCVNTGLESVIGAATTLARSNDSSKGFSFFRSHDASLHTSIRLTNIMLRCSWVMTRIVSAGLYATTRGSGCSFVDE